MEGKYKVQVEDRQGVTVKETSAEMIKSKLTDVMD